MEYIIGDEFLNGRLYRQGRGLVIKARADSEGRTAFTWHCNVLNRSISTSQFS